MAPIISPLPATEVQAGLLNTAWSEAHGKFTLVNDDSPGVSRAAITGWPR